MNHAATPNRRDLTADVVRALTLYSFAEFQLGHAASIRIRAEGNSFSIADDGRGHAIERAVDGTPYLKFIYTHFNYPFETSRNAPVQLQGIGMSLINTLCSELEVTVQKQDVTLQLKFQNGCPCRNELVDVSSSETGIAISGTVSPQVQKEGVDIQSLEQWLLSLLTGSPSLKLFFNGRQLHSLPESDV